MAGTGPLLGRRDVLKLGVFSSAALALPAERLARTQVALSNRISQSALPQPFTIPFKTPPVLAPVRQTQSFDYYAISQRQAPAEILPGRLTDIWGYNGITPGPTIVSQQGRHAVVQQVNDLPAVHPTLRYNVWTSTHLHGSASKPQYDGYANDISNVGFWKDYVYPNVQDARTLWYHDHGVHITAPNSYMGLAAMYLLHDANELSLPIPHGAYDVPLCLRDAMFENNGALLFDDSDQSGVFGDVILVNGVPWPRMPVERRKYRFRILNASISRAYGLRLDSGEPLTVIATDAGLMPHPVPVARLKMGTAERYEVVIDFSQYAIGQRVVMQNVSPDNNIDFDTTGMVMAFDVVAEATDTSNNEVPFDLNPNSSLMGLTAADSMRARLFEFKRDDGRWTINGTTWDDVVNSGFQRVLANPGFGDVEIWEFKNNSGGWFHPVHVHLADFKILDRNGRPPFDYERGPKDTVYVGEGETVRVIMRFAREQGRYMMHCHNIVHEDHDMMSQLLVGTDSPEVDPIHADPPKPLPARPLSDRHDDPGDPGAGAGGGGSSTAGAAEGAPSPTPAGVAAKCVPTKQRVRKKPKRRVLNKKKKSSEAKAPSARCAKPVKHKRAPKRKTKRKRH